MNTSLRTLGRAPVPGLLLALLALWPRVADARDAGLDSELTRTVRAAAEWLSRQALPLDIADPAGMDPVVFPEYAEHPAEVEPSLYAGGAGVLLFLENAAALLDDRELSRLADRVASGLLLSARRLDDGAPT